MCHGHMGHLAAFFRGGAPREAPPMTDATPAPDDPRYTWREAIQYLGIAKDQFYRHVAHEVPSCTIGRRTTWRRSALERWMRDRERLLPRQALTGGGRP